MITSKIAFEWLALCDVAMTDAVLKVALVDESGCDGRTVWLAGYEPIGQKDTTGEVSSGRFFDGNRPGIQARPVLQRFTLYSLLFDDHRQIDVEICLGFDLGDGLGPGRGWLAIADPVGGDAVETVAEID